MTKFEKGPADGKTLMLKRAPRFLRVTQSGEKFDALDQLADMPRADEGLFAYEIVGEPYMVHINRGRNGSGFFFGAIYRFIEPQPSDSEMRLKSMWDLWCRTHVGRPALDK